MIVKLFLEEESDLRRVRIEDDGTPLNFSKLSQIITTTFPQVQLSAVNLSYPDDEGDLVTLSKQSDLVEALHLMDELKKTLRINIVKKNAKESQDEKTRLENVVQTLLQVIAVTEPPTDLVMLKQKWMALMNTQEGMSSLTTLMVLPEFRETLVGAMERVTDQESLVQELSVLKQSGQLEAMVNQIKERVPEASKEFVDEVERVLVSVETPAEQAVEEKEAAAAAVVVTEQPAEIDQQNESEEQQCVESTTEEFNHMKVLLQMVTGSQEPDVKSLSADQAAEVLMNLGFSGRHINQLAPEARIAQLEQLMADMTVAESPVAIEETAAEETAAEETEATITAEECTEQTTEEAASADVNEAAEENSTTAEEQVNGKLCEFNMMMQCVTGSEATDIDSLSKDMAFEILVNLGVPTATLAQWDHPTMLDCIKQKKVEAIGDEDKKEESPDTTTTLEDNNECEDTAAPPQDATVDEVLSASFVKDVSTPDGTTFSPGESFTKTWRLKNTGTTAWPLGCHLVLVNGPQTMIFSAEALITVPPVDVGDSVDISIQLVAPEKPARYIGHWQLSTVDGIKFGDRVWVDIIVVPKAAVELPSASSVFNLIQNALFTENPSAAAPVQPAPATTTTVTAPVEQQTTNTVEEEASTSDVSSGPWERELAELETMGFSDRASNIQLLVSNNGDIRHVINHLLG